MDIPQSKKWTAAQAVGWLIVAWRSVREFMDLWSETEFAVGKAGDAVTWFEHARRFFTGPSDATSDVIFIVGLAILFIAIYRSRPEPQTPVSALPATSKVEEDELARLFRPFITEDEVRDAALEAIRAADASNTEARRVVAILDGIADEMAIWVAGQRERPIAEREEGDPGYVANYVRAWRMRFQHRLENLVSDLEADSDLKQIADHIKHASYAANMEAFESAVVTLRSMAKAIRMDRGL